MARITVVYLGGFGRSGSTLVERMLGAAPGWTNVGELVDLARGAARSDELCGCGVPFSGCPVWNEVGAAAFGGWSEGVLDRLGALQRAAARQRHLPRLLRRTTTGPREIAELRDAYTRIYRAVADVTDAAVVVDASKGPALGQALARAGAIDLRMLNVVRDPRAVAWSWTRHVERPQVAAGGSEMWRVPAPRSAAQWSTLQLEMEAIARFGGAPSARLRYEDFVADPVGSLVEVTARLGLPLTLEDLPPIVGSEVVLAPSHGLSGNPSRFLSGAVELRPDDRWRAAMPTADRAMVTALTLPLLVSYGYARSAAGPRTRGASWVERSA